MKRVVHLKVPLQEQQGRYRKLLFLILMLGLLPLSAKAETRTLTGVVRSESTDEKLIGVTVKVEGSSLGVMTNDNGEYSISVDDGAKNLLFSYLGYRKKIVEIGQSSVINVLLAEDSRLTGEIVVQASRTGSRLKDIPRKVEIVTEDDIEALAPKDATELLKKTAGVDIIEYPGVLSGVSVRGFTPKYSGLDQYVTYLIDGRPAGVTNLATIDMSTIERVEVIKGPSSALYGSQAMGGTINFITKRSKGDVKGHAEFSYGSFKTLDGKFNAGGSLTDKLDFDLGGRTFNQNDDYEIGSNTIISDPDNELLEQQIKTMRNTSYSTNSASLRLGYDFAQDLRFETRGEIYQANSVRTPGSVWAVYGHGQKNVDRQTIDLSLTGNLNQHSFKVKPYWAIEETEYYDHQDDEIDYISSKSKTQWFGFQMQDILSLGDQRITAGVDFNQADVTAHSYSDDSTETAPYRPNQRLSTFGVFSEVALSFLNSRLITNIGGRLDITSYKLKETPYFDNSELDSKAETYSNFNPSVSAQYRLIPELKIHSSAGRAFVTPNPYQKAGKYVNSYGVETRGNADLDPQSSVTFDIGLTYESDMGFRADITYFNTVWDNFIEEVAGTEIDGTDTTNYKTFENVDEAELQGLEFELSYDFGALHDFDYSLRFFANFTHQLVAEKTEDGETSDLNYVRKNRGSFGIEYDDYHFLSARLSARYIGSRYEQNWFYYYPEARPTLTDAVLEHPASLIFDANVTFAINQSSSISVFSKNLLDENYTEKDGYNMPGRSVGVRYAVNF
ncbi:TonB-dependent receptor plug [Chloroherpeton thalassium ATCC 35110]|uniref:TonB-dependent receptor plug n=1 Tax=Chloroherpeton thalassium (strain ATCC 35110 / GB-78) TaxID=517418 RepID=B3QX87_CHLT3|nr:TonB-dependent receptor [Chloroherpeton thalassium]ACF14897.1 TonB-dependent receptor plug [Chloroherpeton thalassium ATCC 35110]